MKGVARVAKLILAALAVGAVVWVGSRIWARSAEVPSITLRLADHASESGPSVVQGTPLVFEVFVTHPRGTGQMQIGRTGDPWYAHLVLQSNGNRAPVIWRPSVLGPPRCLYPVFDRDGKFQKLEQYQGKEAILDNLRHSYTAELGISPERSADIAPGSYTVRAVLKAWSWIPWHWRGRVESNPINLTIQAAGSLSDAQLSERLAESAQFYLLARDYQHASDVSRQLVKRKPNDGDARAALGDALGGLRQDQEALKSYEMARKLISTQPRSREPPDYLWERIVQVHERIHSK
jgi:tetratricopeptide (TPR) repeat protein